MTEKSLREIDFEGLITGRGYFPSGGRENWVMVQRTPEGLLQRRTNVYTLSR